MSEEVREEQPKIESNRESVGDESLEIHYPKGFLVKASDLKKICDDIKNIRDYLLKKQNFLEVTITGSRDEISNLTRKIKSIEDSISNIKKNVSNQNKKIEEMKKLVDEKLKDISRPKKPTPISKKVLNDIKMSMEDDIKEYANDIIKKETMGMKKIEKELRKVMEKELKKRMDEVKDEIKKFEKDFRENLHDNVEREMEKIEAKRRRKALKEAEKVEPFTLTKKEKEIADLLNGGLKPKEIAIITDMSIDEVKKIIKIIKKKVKI